MKRTTDSKIRSALRALWLRSSERSEALKRGSYCCADCGVKQSRAKGKEQKVEVHHKAGVLNWDIIISAVKAYLLCDPDMLEVLCPDCHKKKEHTLYD